MLRFKTPLFLIYIWSAVLPICVATVMINGEAVFAQGSGLLDYPPETVPYYPPEPSVPTHITGALDSSIPGENPDVGMPYPFSIGETPASPREPYVRESPVCLPPDFHKSFPQKPSVESRFACWDSSLKACIPGFGRELPTSDAPWVWQMMPQGILFRSYMASDREAKMGVPFFHESKGNENYWDPALGGKVGILRYGNFEALYPEGIQVDLDCAALARLTAGNEWEVWGTDYRFGAAISARYGKWEGRFGYFHISSHRGDELMVRQGTLERRNYVRDTLQLAVGYRPDANWRFYFEVNLAVWTDDGAEPWQFEMGFEYSPIMMPNFKGSPFMAFHCRLSEDNDFGETITLHAGWQWKSLYQQTFRTGLYFMSGYSDQYQFYNVRERQIGWGAWLDF